MLTAEMAYSNSNKVHVAPAGDDQQPPTSDEVAAAGGGESRTSSNEGVPADDGQVPNSDKQAASQRKRISYMDPKLYKAAAGGEHNELRGFLPDHKNELTPNGNTVLHVAAQFGKKECVAVIVDPKQHSGSSDLLLLLRLPNQNGDTPLHLAAREGHHEVVQDLIAAEKESPSSPDIESVVKFPMMMNGDGNTALHEAVRYKHPKVVEFLIDNDPKLTDDANSKGITPLYMAAERGFSHLASIILQKSSSTAAHAGPMGRTALHAAVISDHHEMVEKILEHKAFLIEEVDKDGWSPLHCAAYLGYKKIAKQLLDKLPENASQVIYLPIKMEHNRTALHIAASRGHKGVAKLLASYYPDCCEQVDSEGNNVIHLFMSQRRHFLKLLCVRWFRGRGLLNGKNNAGQTPLHLLAELQMDHGTDFIMSEKVDKMALNKHNLSATDIISSKSFLGRRDSILRKLKSVKAGAGPLSWQKVVEAINAKKVAHGSKDIEEGERIRSEDKGGVLSRRFGGGGIMEMEGMKKKGENHLIVVTLIAAISFAAGFALPGGYDDDDGAAILTRKTAFKIFVVADTTALVLSMAAVCVYFFMALNNRKEVLHEFFNWGFNLTMYAMGAMMIAFVMGLYTVLPDSTWLAAFICAISGLFFLFLSYILRKFYSSWKVMIKSSFWFRKFKLFLLKRQILLMERGKTCFG